MSSRRPTADAGYIAIEPESIVISFKSHEQDINLRLDVELLGAEDILRWSSNSATKFSSSNLKMVKQSDNDKKAKDISYVVGLDMYERTIYLDLSTEVMSTLANASVVLKVVRIKKETPITEVAPPPITEKVKGKASAPVAVPSTPTTVEEPIIEYTIPISYLFLSKGSMLDFSTCLNESTKGGPQVEFAKSVVPSKTNFLGRLFADNDLADYVTGCRFLRWDAGIVEGLPSEWGLHVVEVPEGKQKVAPTESELRHKFIENNLKLVAEQADLVLISISIAETKSLISSGSESAEELWVSTVSSPKLNYDQKLAKAVKHSDDIKIAPGLWSIVCATESNYSFLHRSQVRALIKAAGEGPINWQAKLSRSPVKTDVSNTEGPPLELGGVVDVATLTKPDELSNTFRIPLYPAVDEGMMEEEPIEESAPTAFLSVTAVLSAPLRTSVSLPAPPSTIVQTLTQRGVSTTIPSRRDVMSELRAEIVSVVREIAQEYVNIYPTAPAPPAPGGGESEMDQRKSSFLHHLSASGVYHAFKERLKPRIQRVVREKYGVRGRALGNSGTLLPPEGADDVESTPLDQLLGELYLFLVKECNLVLNELYRNTMIAKDEEELERIALMAQDDETEAPKQAFQRLLRLAGDCELDERPDTAEQYHLERIQLLGQTADLGADPECVIGAYKAYAGFLLRQSKSGAATEGEDLEGEGGEDSARTTGGSGPRSRAVEALELAAAAAVGREEEWETRLLLACTLMDDGSEEKLERAAVQLQLALGVELRQNINNNKVKLTGSETPASAPLVEAIALADKFDGYESDDLSPVQPQVHVAFSLLFQLQKRTMAARKALKMAVRVYSDGDGLYSPPLKEHGRPRRTAVIALTQMSIYLFSFNLNVLGVACLANAKDCEQAATAKANERGMSAVTPVLVRHLLLRAEGLAALAQGAYLEAAEFGRECVPLAPKSLDGIAGWLIVARAISAGGYSPQDDPLTLQVDAYSRAISIQSKSANEVSSGEVLLAFLKIGKLFLSQGRYQEGLAALLTGCQRVSSASLFLLLGIAALRLDRFVDAEDALQESNLLDCRRAEVWAYLSLMCLGVGSGGGAQRLAEAEKATEQALRLGLRDANLLRELATGYMSVDLLQMAEDLIRRALVADSDRGTAHTRKMLGDVLASQNHAAAAVDEYQAVLGDELADRDTREAAARNCAIQLRSLGRMDELASLESIAAALEFEM